MSVLNVINLGASVGLLQPGFLGTAAPLYADLILLLEIGMGLALLVGAGLVRRRMYRWHARCQSAVVLLNLVAIVLTMLPSFTSRVLPKIPAKLHRPPYALATAHAVVGSIAEFGGLYLLVAAGTEILPERFQLTNYKAWMRAALLLWWLVLLLGIATYAILYTSWA